jgi:serpin B
MNIRLLVPLGLVVIGCGSATPSNQELRSNLSRVTDPNVPAGDLSTLVGDNTTFAAAFHRTMATAATGNLFYSPFDISLDMAMVSVVLGGSNTAGGIASALDLSLPPAQLNPAFDQLDLILTGIQGKTERGNGAQITIGNAFWSMAKPDTGSLDTLAQYYGAGVLQGNDPQQAIEDWQSTQPGPKLPFQLASPTDLAVVSALSFDGAWQQAFDPAKTQPAAFTRLDGSTVTVPFMSQVQMLATETQTGARAIDIPYDGGSLSILIVVPDDLPSFEAQLTPQVIAGVVQGLATGNVSLTLPKFTLQSSTSVLPALQSLGLPLDSGHWQVWHSAQVQVSEAGTQASALTVTSHTPNAVVTPVPFAVASPFLFFIHDHTTGTIVFTGRVVDPTAGG